MTLHDHPGLYEVHPPAAPMKISSRGGHSAVLGRCLELQPIAGIYGPAVQARVAPHWSKPATFPRAVLMRFAFIDFI